MKKIVITTGDVDGIGLEVTIKALRRIQLPKNYQIILWRSKGFRPRFLIDFLRSKNAVSVQTLKDALEQSCPYVEITSDKNPALWFEETVKNSSRIDAIVTAPLSKLTIQKSGLQDAGHTDILRRITKAPVHMAFMGQKFSLMLLTDHIAYRNVPSKLTRKNLARAIDACENFLKLQRKSRGKIGVLGLNPHAGEIQKLGTEERQIIIPVIKHAQRQGKRVYGPLIPDICFQPGQVGKYDVYIAMYHDQGLIPFKIYHKGKRGIQVSVNLPFVRTSVDHGTAKDIFGKNLADPSSMIMAIQKSIEWC